MSKYFLPQRAALWFLILCLLSSGAFAQKKAKASKASKPAPKSEAVLWEPVDIRSLDLFAGPGGESMVPDVSSVTLIKEEKKGHNKKYRIRDAKGNVWVAKLGREARPETAAVRLLYGLGYKTEVNYLVPSLNIPGKGTFSNVRLEARPDNVERLGEWKWRSNPFVGTHELEGLKMMMVFMSNWDVVDLQNQILQVNGGEQDYIISDLGATFGKLGNNNLPVIYRFGRKTGSAKHYSKTSFVREVKNGQVKLAYKGKNRKLLSTFSMADARWLSNNLNRLSDTQIRDAFRAAYFSPAEVDTYTTAVRRKIDELNRAVGSPVANNR